MRPLRQTRTEPPLRRDPAPSRWAYRMQRLWLTPLFRVLVRVGLPAFLIAFFGGVWLADADRRASFAGMFTDMRDAIQSRPEFMVRLVAIEGASPVLAESIRRALALDLPKSSFDIDMTAAHAQVTAFDAVQAADLRIQPGGVLQVNVTERLPAVVWRSAEGLWLLDAEGHRIAAITARALRADLPLITGEGADRAVPEALALVAAAGPLLPRLRGLVRFGERRWDVVLDRDQRLLLPAANPVRALERAIALDEAQGLLARDLVAIDLRHAQRPTLRLTPRAAAELRGAPMEETGKARL